VTVARRTFFVGGSAAGVVVGPPWPLVIHAGRDGASAATKSSGRRRAKDAGCGGWDRDKGCAFVGPGWAFAPFWVAGKEVLGEGAMGRFGAVDFSAQSLY
jgi:hypothetical protein